MYTGAVNHKHIDKQAAMKIPPHIHIILKIGGLWKKYDSLENISFSSRPSFPLKIGLVLLSHFVHPFQHFLLIIWRMICIYDPSLASKNISEMYLLWIR